MAAGAAPAATAIFLVLSRQIVAMLEGWREATEAVAERTFLSIYGSPKLQAAMGLDPESSRPLRKAGKSALHKLLVESRVDELRSRIGEGGLRECLVRSALYIGMGHGSVDERTFELIRRIRLAKDGLPRLTLAKFKALVREQFFMLLIDEEASLAAIPALLPAGADERQTALTLLRQVVSARGELGDEGAKRLERITRLFDVESTPADVSRIGRREGAIKEGRSRAS
jgi:hypothetical protein